MRRMKDKIEGSITNADYANSAGSVAWDKVSGKPSSYPPSSHTHAYLPTGGGTMSGNIAFSDIGNTNTSNKISWNGSTDGADIYYQTTAQDQGNLVINLRDDSDCYLRIAKNGAFKSYFSPDDGNFHGNVNGTADTATSATTSNGVKDYNDANKTIQIGYAGSGLTASNLNFIAGYTDNGTKIKDVSKDVLTSWIGLGNYLPLSGGTMTGQITKTTGGSWIGDRDRATVKSGYSGDSSYGAVAAMATKNGYWTMGNLGGNESLIFNYSTDSNYSAGKNETSQVYLPAQAGTIITSATIGNQSVNYANSAGSATNATNATTATKLSSSAGSNTQPVYFSDGKPVVIGYTIAKSVPADAKFTDTNTWRGIQNNLTSDSTDQSLSAAQGKALKTLVDGKAPASHTHIKSQITDFPTSMPASDVSAWAKAATKPSYTKAEVGLGNVDNTADKDKSVKYAETAGTAEKAVAADNGIVAFNVNNTSTMPTGYIRFNNGIQICWGKTYSGNASGSFTYPQSFSVLPSVMISGTGAYRYAFYITKFTKTGFGYYRDGSGETAKPQYIAIGSWE